MQVGLQIIHPKGFMVPRLASPSVRDKMLSHPRHSYVQARPRVFGELFDLSRRAEAYPSRSVCATAQRLTLIFHKGAIGELGHRGTQVVVLVSYAE